MLSSEWCGCSLADRESLFGFVFYFMCSTQDYTPCSQERARTHTHTHNNHADIKSEWIWMRLNIKLYNSLLQKGVNSGHLKNILARLTREKKSRYLSNYWERNEKSSELWNKLFPVRPHFSTSSRSLLRKLWIFPNKKNYKRRFEVQYRLNFSALNKASVHIIL